MHEDVNTKWFDEYGGSPSHSLNPVYYIFKILEHRVTVDHPSIITLKNVELSVDSS